MKSTIVVNGEHREVVSGSGLNDLLREIGKDPRTVAIEYNGEILPRDAFEAVVFSAGDQLEIVHFVQGG